MNKPSPGIEGNLEISRDGDGVFIGGDPVGLRSLATLLVWLADFDQEIAPNLRDGSRCHTHLYAHDLLTNREALTKFSVDTQVCRLDAKGTGEFPGFYGEYRRNSAQKT